MTARASKVTIRPVAPGDYDRWLPLWQGYNRFYERNLDDAVTRETWRRFFDAQEPVYALVAVDNDSVLGLAHYLFHRSTSTIVDNCYLQDLFTVPIARRRGVGAALIEGVYAQAAHKGVARVYWHTHETNGTARQLYDKIANYSGFVVYRKLLR